MEIIRKTIENDEEFLRQVSSEVDFETDDYMSWINALREYCENNAVFALAPVQIGIPKRIIYIRNTSSDTSKNIDSSYNEDMVLINPVILKCEGKTIFLEGCNSCKEGEIYLTGEVFRPYSIEVEYLDIDENIKRETFYGFKTTVFCHEFDHLNGVLHIDKAENIMKKTWAEMKAYRDVHPYDILSKTGEFFEYGENKQEKKIDLNNGFNG